MISLRLLVFFHAHPEKIQFIRNASYEYWYAYKKLRVPRGDVSDNWAAILYYIDHTFPSIYFELEEMTGNWDAIDREEFEENG